MKRYLQNHKHQLSMREQEDIWRGIQARTGRGGAPRNRRRIGLPVFGLTTVTALVLLVAVWFNQKDAPDKIARQVRESAVQQVVRDESEIIGNVEPAQPFSDKPEGTIGEEVALVGPQQEPVIQEKSVPVAPVPLDEKVNETRTKGADPSNQLDPAPPPAEQPKPVETFEKFAIESVEESLRKQAGVEPREGELYVRGGRSGEMKVDGDVEGLAEVQSRVIPSEQPMKMARRAEAELHMRRIAQVATDEPPLVTGSVTGGTTPPNGAQAELMYHEHTGVNPFVATEEDALSTFAVDVDNASYTMVRNYLNHGELPPQAAVRVEEFVNFFDAGYPGQTDQVFAIHTDGAPSRFGDGYHLLRVGLKGMDIDASERKPANLIFVIDVSGSMSRENRLQMVKKSLHILLDELGEGDRVGIVIYGNRGEVILEPTDLSQRERIVAAIDRLGPTGATNACEGLEVAYDLARRHYDPALLNRLILCSDGVANLGGATRAEEMLAKVRRQSDEGITLSTVGFGMGNYNDVLMEKLADQGDGNYHYVDKLEEAERVFRQNLTGLLQTIAREVKVQVEFDPDRVQRWRLLGYENRDVADRDFRNDKVDAGEVGAGHEVTALYELKLKSGGGTFQLDDDSSGGSLGTVRVRFEYPTHDTVRAGQVKEISHRIDRSDVDTRFARTAPEYRLQVLAAEFAEILRNSYWARESSLNDLVPMADGLARELKGDEANGAKAEELAGLIRRAAELQAQREAREVPTGGED